MTLALRPIIALRLFALSLALAPLCAHATPMLGSAVPIPNGQQEPVLIEADDMQYDQKNRIVTAMGNVEITQGQRILLAQKVAYHEPSDTVYASGNVSVLEPDGNVYFAENIQLKDQLKAGVVKQLQARLADNSVFAANEAIRHSETKVEMNKAVYSPCKLCSDENGNPENPLWQLKARNVIVDEAEQKVTYRDARLEVLGVPIAYTPYLSHPTPDADAKSGILAPSYKRYSSLGTMVEVPYYISIAPNMDATLTPVYASLESPILKSEFRHLTESGRYSFRGSITNPDARDDAGNRTTGKDIRGHIEGTGQFTIDDTWNWGFSGKRSTDDTYLRRYDISNEQILTSRAFVEGIGHAPEYNRSYALAEAISFQGLRSFDDPGETPLILPSLQGHHTYRLGDSRLRLEGNALALTRDEGSSTQRLIGIAEWTLPYTTQNGHVFEVAGTLRNDIYQASGLNDALGREYDALTNRFAPEAKLGWRYPILAYSANTRTVIEPQVEAIAAPTGLNSDDIPNEDSQGIDFSDSNLFSTGRYTGYDRIEEGHRINYGMRVSTEWRNNITTNLLFGQTYHLSTADGFPYSNDPDSHLSDYVGSMELGLPWLLFSYRYRIDKETAELVRNEVMANLTFSRFRGQSIYTSLKNDPSLANQESIYAYGALGLTDEWWLSANGRYDLQGNGQWLSNGVGITYQNECITLLTSIGRRYYRDRDIEPATSYTFQVFLKNLN